MNDAPNEVALEERAGGVAIPVRAQPGARRNGLGGVQAGALKVAVTVAPEQGKANDRIVELLAETLRLRKSDVELVSGATSRTKKFLVRGVALDDLRRRIAQALEKAG